MEEIWKPVKDYPGYYVSNHGRVLSTKSKKPRYLKPGDNKAGRAHEQGYLHVVLCKDGETKMVRIARLVAQHFIPNPDNLPQVDHIDGNKHNNHWTNLRWVTNEENQKNRDYSFTTGVNSFHAKLTEDQVREIRKRLAAGELQKSIAKDYPINKNTISSIKNGRSWAWLD